MEIGFKQSEDLMNFKFSFSQNQKGYLRAALEFVDEFLKTCVDQVVQELIVEITTLVFDYSEQIIKMKFGTSENKQTTSGFANKGFGGGFLGTTTTTQTHQQTVSSFSVPFYAIFMELMCALSTDDKVLYHLTSVLERCKLSNQI